MTNQPLIYFQSCKIKSPLGELVAVASDDGLLLLEFNDSPKMNAKRSHLNRYVNLIEDRRAGKGVIELLRDELEGYFLGRNRSFRVPLLNWGTLFQKRVWEALRTIPHGDTWSYEGLAENLSTPKAVRAIAQANGANLLPIIIPCHRVINKSGALGGYASGLARKEWLLNHEKSFN